VNESPTDSSLLKRVRKHDPAAWDELVAWAGPLVFSWCGQASLGKEDREDVFQEVFLKVYRGLQAFQYGRPGQSFRGWLLIITRNAIIDFARRRLQEPLVAGYVEYQALLDNASERLPDSEADSPTARHVTIRRALDLLHKQFSEENWKAFWRTAVDGLTATEAGKELGMDPAAVRKAKSRVLARLRQDFQGLLD